MVEIVHIGNVTAPKLIKTCMECRFRIGALESPKYWYCGFSGFPCTSEEETESDNACGPEKRFWMQRPPEPPPSPRKLGFWERLGDAIIEKIRGKAHADQIRE